MVGRSLRTATGKIADGGARRVAPQGAGLPLGTNAPSVMLVVGVGGERRGAKNGTASRLALVISPTDSLILFSYK